MPSRAKQACGGGQDSGRRRSTHDVDMRAHDDSRNTILVPGNEPDCPQQPSGRPSVMGDCRSSCSSGRHAGALGAHPSRHPTSAVSATAARSSSGDEDLLRMSARIRCGSSTDHVRRRFCSQGPGARRSRAVAWGAPRLVSACRLFELSNTRTSLRTTPSCWRITFRPDCINLA